MVKIFAESLSDGMIERKIIMMQSMPLSKWIKILLLIGLSVITTSCNTINSLNSSSRIPVEENTTSEEKPTINYTIKFRDSSDFYVLNNSDDYKKYPWSNQFSFNIIEISNMENLSVAKIANDSIKNAMLSWIGGKVINAYAVDLSILYNSSKYLSFLNCFEYISNRIDYIYDYITIDMQTGKRVMLNDLIEINENFVEYIQQGNIAKESNYHALDTSSEVIWEFLNSIEPLDLLKEFEKCSLSQDQVIQYGYYTIDDSIEALVFRNSFFLQDNTIVIVLQHGGEIYITLCLDDITDFLKVEKW